MFDVMFSFLTSHASLQLQDITCWDSLKDRFLLFESPPAQRRNKSSPSGLIFRFNEEKSFNFCLFLSQQQLGVLQATNRNANYASYAK